MAAAANQDNNNENNMTEDKIECPTNEDIYRALYALKKEKNFTVKAVVDELKFKFPSIKDCKASDNSLYSKAKKVFEKIQIYINNKQGESSNRKEFGDSRFFTPVNESNEQRMISAAVTPRKKKLAKKIVEKKEQNKTLKRKLKLAEDNVETLEKVNDSLETEINNLEHKYKYTMNGMMSITDQLKEVANIQETFRLKTQLGQFENKFNEKSKLLDQVQEELKLTKKKLNSEATKYLNRKRKKVIMEKNTSTITKLKENNDAISTEVQSLNKELHETNLDLEKTEEKLNHLKSDRKRLMDKISYLKSQRSKAKQGIIDNEMKNEEEIIKLKEEINELQDRNKILQETVELLQDTEIKTFENGKYSYEIRQVMMELFSMGVSFHKVDNVIKSVLKTLANKNIENLQLPSMGTKSRFMVEARYLSMYQVASALTELPIDKSSGHCLHGDGASKFHQHYQGFQATTASGKSYTLGLQEVVDGSAQGTLDSFLSVIEELRSAFNKGLGEQNQLSLGDLVCSFKNTMSDQGPNNPPFNKKLDVFREELLPEVVKNWNNLNIEDQNEFKEMGHYFCKMHIVVNMASEADKALASFEKLAAEGKNPFAFDTSGSGAVRLIRTSCKAFHPRGHQGAGVATYFKSFLDGFDEKLHMVDFVGNRFNIVFYDAAAVYYHKKHIIDFLDSWPDLNRLLLSVQADVAQDVFLAGIRALGMIRKVVTSPFWRTIEKEGSILELNSDLKNMQQKFEEWAQDSYCFMKGETLFDEVELEKDDIYYKLFEDTGLPEFESLTQQALELIFSSLLILLERQAQDQLPGGKYAEPSESLLKQAANVPKTNTISERDFAYFDYLIRQKPAASLLHQEALLMWVNNQTPVWLRSLDDNEKSKIMENAMKDAPVVLYRFRKRQNELKIKKKERLLKKQNDKRTADDEKRIMRGQLLRRVNTNGGLWKTGTEIYEFI